MHTHMLKLLKFAALHTISPVRIDLTKGSPTKLDIKMPKKKDSLPIYIPSRKDKNYDNKFDINHISAYHFSFPQPTL